MGLLLCSHGNRLKVKVSGIELTLDIKRLDPDIFKAPSGNRTASVSLLGREYGTFFSDYNENVIALGNPADSLFPTYLEAFLEDTVILQARTMVDSAFKDLTPIQTRLEGGFRHFRYYCT